MQCPLCHTTLPEDAQTCPSCRLDLATLHAFLVLRLDLERVREGAANLATQLHHLQEHFDTFEAHIYTRLGGVRPAPRVSVIPAENPLTLRQVFPVRGTASPPPVDLPRQEPSAELPPTAPRAQGAEVQFGQKWLLIAGVAITVLGIGFFLKYAFDQNWVGPTGRIALSYLAAMLFLGVGEGFRRRQGTTFGLYLIGGGIATLYLTTFAAYQLYSLLTQVPAFGLMFLVTVFAALLAVLYDAAWLAVLGLIGGFLTPVLLRTGQDHQVVLMSYIALLNAGVLAIAAFKRWQVLNALGFVCTWLLFAGWAAGHYTASKFWTTLVFLHLFFLIYALVPFMYYFVRQSRERFTGLSIATANTLVTFAFAFYMIDDYFDALPVVSLATLAYAALFLAMATYLYRRQPQNLEPFVLLLAKGILFLILTVPILFSGHWITTFWILQAAVTLWAGTRLRNRWLCLGALVLLALTVGKFLVYDYEEVFRLRAGTLSYAGGFGTLLLERWSTMVMVVGALFWSAQRLQSIRPVLGIWQHTAGHLLSAAFAVVLFLGLTFEVSAFFYDHARQARFAALSVLWGVCSIALMILGFVKQQVLLRFCALGLFAITVLKVFLVDLGEVSTPLRIISFVVLGLLLIGASYLYYRYRESVLPRHPEGQP